jgi:hypothetical protein
MSRQNYIIGIVGVRDYNNTLYTNNTYVVRTIEQHLAKKGLDTTGVSFVTGGGRGVESMAVNWCEAKNIECRKIPPNLAGLGPRKAFTVRNNHIVSQCDELIVFWDGCIDVISECIVTAMHQHKVATIYPVI